MRIALLVGVAGLALGTAARAQDVSYDFDPSANFAGYKTYAWNRGTPVNDELNHKRIMASIDSRLAAKGLVRVEPGAKPDVLVAYHTKFDKALQVSGFSSGWGRYGLAGNRTGSARAEDITVGTLVVDIMDANARAIVWRGIATKDVDLTTSPEKRDKNINKATEKLFKNYPPKR